MLIQITNKKIKQFGTLAAGMVLGMALGIPLPLQAADQPDFSGVYRSYRVPAAAAPAAPTAILKAAAQAKVDEINFILDTQYQSIRGSFIKKNYPAKTQ
mgnify:CR=1 FL=1